MLVTIHNLPHNTQYSDIKSLINSKCGLRDIILDNLLPEGGAKKVTVGVADDGDAAMLVRNLNGIYMQNMQLFVEVLRQRYPEDQPYHNQSPNMKNNQHNAGAPSSGISGMYQNSTVQQMMSSHMRPPQMDVSQMAPPQMGMPQMVPPPFAKLDNFKSVTSMSLNYDAPQTSQVGFGMQQLYSNSNTIPSLISYPMKQNLDYGFQGGNQQNTNQNDNQPWGNFNANTFNAPGENNFTPYSNNNRTRFDQRLSGPQSQVDNRMNYTMQRGQAQKRKRSNSPVHRQSYSHQGGSYWNNKNESTSSGRKGTSSSDQARSRNFNMYGSHVTDSFNRNEASGNVKRNRWSASPSQSFNSKKRDPPKSNFSNRNSNFDGSKRFKYSKHDTKQSAPPKYATNEKNKRGGTDTTTNKNTNNSTLVVPSKKILENDKDVRARAAVLITTDIFNNPTLNKTTDDIPESLIHETLMQAVKARVILLSNARYDLTREYCFQMYRQKFKEQDDQHFYNVIVNRCKRQIRMQKEGDYLTAQEVSEDLNAGTSTQDVTNSPADTKSPDQQKKQLMTPAVLPNRPEGAHNKEAAKLQFEEGPDSVKCDSAIMKAVFKEMDDIDNVMLQVFENLLQKADPVENKFADIYKKLEVNRKINEALQENVLRGLLQTKEKPLLRITGNPKLPKKQSLLKFLADYGILNLKKSDKNSFYVATCGTQKDFDELCLMENVVIDNVTVSFRPMHIDGPPNTAIKDKSISNNFKSSKRAPEVQPNKPLHNETSNEDKNTGNNEAPTNISDDTENKQAFDTVVENVVKEEDLKSQEQTQEILENKDENRGVKEEMDVINKDEVIKSVIKDDLDWPEVGEGDKSEWMEDTEIKEELHNVTIDNSTETGVENDIKEVKVDEIAVIKTVSHDESVVHVDEYEAKDADDINMNEVDDDDLEDY